MDKAKAKAKTKAKRNASHTAKPLAARPIVIAIDGPAGSGKSTLAARLARRYGYINIESGAMYRALALKAITQGVPLDDGQALGTLARQSRIDLLPGRESNQVLLDGKDVTERIRLQDVTSAASRVSVHPPVREWMVRCQQEMGAGGGIVMEGRDIGTKVFPQAEVKIFLDAAPEVRGTRRFLQDPGTIAKEAAVVAELRARDERDRTRPNSPLVPASDAAIIDSTNLTLEQVVERAVAIVEEQLQRTKK